MSDSNGKNGELDHVQVSPISVVFPAPENTTIYRAISFDDVRELVNSIKERGIQEPILVSSDRFHYKRPPAPSCCPVCEIARGAHSRASHQPPG